MYKVNKSPWLIFLQRDWLIAMRQKGEWAVCLLFFVIVTSLFPIAVGPSDSDLSHLAAGIIWLAAMLATILSLDNLFKSDYIQGNLEQLILSQYSISWLLIMKILVHWLITSLPLIILTPVIGLTFGLPWSLLKILILSLLLGTPSLSLIGAIGAALTVILPRGGILLVVIMLPLYVPVLIIGTVAMAMAVSGLSCAGHLALLAALSIICLLIVPYVIGFIIKASMV